MSASTYLYHLLKDIFYTNLKPRFIDTDQSVKEKKHLDNMNISSKQDEV